MRFPFRCFRSTLALGVPFDSLFHVGAAVFYCDPNCEDSSHGLLCWYTAGVSIVMVPPELVATEPVLISWNRATSECSAATVSLFPTKNVAMASPKGLVA